MSPSIHVDSRPDPHVLLADLAFPESPRWHDGRLWFSDWGAHEVIAVDLGGQERGRRARASHSRCASTHLPDGRLLIVSAADRRLLRQEPDGSLVTHADLAGLAEHPWNDIVVDGRGNAYVNNVGFDFPGGEFAPGIVALVTPDGVARQVADGVAFPNGMAVTARQRDADRRRVLRQRLTAFDIGADGSLSGRRTWADLGDDHPDGICLDAEGAVWYADVGNKRCVRVREGGEVLRRDRSGPRLLRLHARRPGSANPVHDRQSMGRRRGDGRDPEGSGALRGRPGAGHRMAVEQGARAMSLGRVQFFSVSLDGFGTGEGQSLETPFGHAGDRLHE